LELEKLNGVLNGMLRSMDQLEGKTKEE